MTSPLRASLHSRLEVLTKGQVQTVAEQFGVAISFKHRTTGSVRFLHKDTMIRRLLNSCERDGQMTALGTFLGGGNIAEHAGADAIVDIPFAAPVKSNPVSGAGDEVAQAISRTIGQALAGFKPDMDKKAIEALIDSRLSTVEAMVSDALSKVRLPQVIEVRTPDKVTTIDGLHHKSFKDLLQAVQAGVNVWLPGPAGSGKTVAAERVAEALGLDFYSNGAIDSEYKLSGFIDANGNIHNTAFRKAFTQGGLYLFDEVDVSLPSATLAFNAALSNDWQDFPGEEKPVRKHPDFRVIAAANTLGNGANLQYVGRAVQDGAFLDRFVMLPWAYDEELEAALSTPEIASEVQRIRAKLERAGINVIVSPRACINIKKLLEAGCPRSLAFDMAIWNRMSEHDRKAVS